MAEGQPGLGVQGVQKEAVGVSENIIPTQEADFSLRSVDLQALCVGSINEWNSLNLEGRRERVARALKAIQAKAAELYRGSKAAEILTGLFADRGQNAIGEDEKAALLAKLGEGINVNVPVETPDSKGASMLADMAKDFAAAPSDKTAWHAKWDSLVGDPDLQRVFGEFKNSLPSSEQPK